jgi:hypothetical protein
MVNEYMVTAYMDENCQIEVMRFRQMGFDSIAKKVHSQFPDWEVIILTPLWDDSNPQGNYWTRNDVYPA